MAVQGYIDKTKYLVPSYVQSATLCFQAQTMGRWGDFFLKRNDVIQSIILRKQYTLQRESMEYYIGEDNFMERLHSKGH